jgi:hypothetical protein
LLIQDSFPLAECKLFYFLKCAILEEGVALGQFLYALTVAATSARIAGRQFSWIAR